MATASINDFTKRIIATSLQTSPFNETAVKKMAEKMAEIMSKYVPNLPGRDTQAEFRKTAAECFKIDLINDFSFGSFSDLAKGKTMLRYSFSDIFTYERYLQDYNPHGRHDLEKKIGAQLSKDYQMEFQMTPNQLSYTIKEIFIITTSKQHRSVTTNFAI